MIQGVEQGECEECGENDDNYRQQSRTYNNFPEDEDEEWDGIEYVVMCDCGKEASVSITDNGLTTTGPITHENASWNEDDHDE